MENTFTTATESTQKEELDKITNHLQEIALPFFQSWIDGVSKLSEPVSIDDISCHWIPYTNSIHIILNYEKITDSMRFELNRTLSVARANIQNFSLQDLAGAIKKNMFIKNDKDFPYLNYANAKSIPCELGKYIDSIKRFNLDRNLIAPQQPSAPTNKKGKAEKLTKISKTGRKYAQKSKNDCPKSMKSVWTSQRNTSKIQVRLLLAKRVSLSEHQSVAISKWSTPVICLRCLYAWM